MSWFGNKTGGRTTTAPASKAPPRAVAQTPALDYETLDRANVTRSEAIRTIAAYASDLRAEAKEIHDAAERAEKAGGEIDARDAARFEEIAGDGGLLDEADERMKLVKAHKARVDRLVIAQNQARGPDANPLDSPDGKPVADSLKATTGPTRLEFQANDGSVVRALTLEDRFVPHAAGEDHVPPLAERIVAKLTGRPLAMPNGSALFEGEDGAGGFLTGTQTFGPMIDLARPASVAFQAGAQLLPMDQAEGTFAQLLSDPKVHWAPELSRVPSSSMTFGKITLKPKKLAAIVPVSLEMIEDAQNAGQLVQQALSQAMAVALDQAILSGAGTGSEPLGIRNQAGVNTVAADNPIGDYSDLEDAIEKIDRANYPGDPSGLAWIANPRDASQFNRLQAADGQPLTPTPGAAALSRYKTTSLPTDLGAGSDSEMIVGDMSQVVVGMRTGATVRFLPAGTATDEAGVTINAAEQFATLVVVHMRADVAVIRPEWLTVVQGVNWS